jgi:hypothetical protein
MSQLLDILSDSLTEIGQLGVGQTISPEQSQQGFRLIQRIIGKLSAQRVFLFAIAQRPFTLIAGTQLYSLGPSGTLGAGVQTRPVFVQTARCSGVGSAQDSPLTLVDDVGWAGIRDKGATNSALGLPQVLFPQYLMPNVNLYLWPIPSAAITLTLGTWELLQNFLTIFDTITLPPGYEDLLQQLLAIEWAPMFDIPISPGMSQLAADAIRAIQGINVQGLGGAFGEAQRLENIPNLAIPKPQGGPPPPQQ